METLGFIVLVCSLIVLFTWDIPKWILGKLGQNVDDYDDDD